MVDLIDKIDIVGNEMIGGIIFNDKSCSYQNGNFRVDIFLTRHIQQ